MKESKNNISTKEYLDTVNKYSSELLEVNTMCQKLRQNVEVEIKKSLERYREPSEERARLIVETATDIINEIDDFVIKKALVLGLVNIISLESQTSFLKSKGDLLNSVLTEYNLTIDWISEINSMNSATNLLENEVYKEISERLNSSHEELQIKYLTDTILIQKLHKTIISGMGLAILALKSRNTIIKSFASRNLNLRNKEVLGEFADAAIDLSTDEILTISEELAGEVVSEFIPFVKIGKVLYKIGQRVKRINLTYQQRGHLDEVFDFYDLLILVNMTMDQIELILKHSTEINKKPVHNIR